ncbi:MAG: hypothetical protein U0U70_09225 [Chitinophagaceae bacterium]
MISKELVQAYYENLTDQKLVEVIKEDGLSVTHEAFIVIKREYRKRHLDPSFIEVIEKKRQEHAVDKINENRKQEGIINSNRIIRGILVLKGASASDDAIFKWLVKEGIDPDDAMKGTGEIETLTKHLYKKAKKTMALSMLFIFTGVLLCVGCLQGELRNIYLLSGIILIVMPARFFYTNHRFYKLCEKAMQVIEKEKADR